MTKDEIIAKLNSMAKYPTVTLPRDTEALRLAAKLLKQSTEQEPVAFRTESRITKAVGYWTDRVPDYIDANSWEITPLYTTPPQRQPLVIDSQKKAIEYIEKTLWEVIDVAAMFPEAKPDPRTWEHLMVYKPMVYKPQPQEAAPRKPLTDEEIEAVFKQVEVSDFYDCVVPFARAIEAAHGITGEKE